MTIEIVDFPIKNCDSIAMYTFYQRVNGIPPCSPELRGHLPNVSSATCILRDEKNGTTGTTAGMATGKLREKPWLTQNPW